MFVSHHTLKWTRTCRSHGRHPHAHTAHFLLNRHIPGRMPETPGRPVRGARRFRGAGRRGPAVRIPPGPVAPAGSAASRAMEGSNLRLRFWRPSGCRCPNGAFMFSALRFSSLVADRPCGGMRRYASPVAGIPYAGRVCIPGRVYASVCIRGCIRFRSPFRLVSSVPGMVRRRVCIVCINPL